MRQTEHHRSYYPRDSAGRIMTTNIPTYSDEQTIQEVERDLEKRARLLDSINYLYIVTKNGKLKGVVSIKEIFQHNKSEQLKNVMIRDIATVRGHTDQEHVAYLALQRNIKAVPVVDKDNVFLGVVPSDTILKTLYQEAQEDILQLAGVSSGTGTAVDSVMDMSLWRLFFHRIPWLIIGLMGGLVSAQIISFFSGTIQDNIILASFIPLVVYMAGAVSMQVGVFVIRDTAINPKLNFWKYFLKQFAVIIMIAVFTSLLFFAYSFVLKSGLAIGLALSLALFAAVTSAVFSGLVVPYVFSKMKSDPANASGPIATIIQDLTSISLYFLIASALLS